MLLLIHVIFSESQPQFESQFEWPPGQPPVAATTASCGHEHGDRTKKAYCPHHRGDCGRRKCKHRMVIVFVTVQLWGSISDYIPHFSDLVITYPCSRKALIYGSAHPLWHSVPQYTDFLTSRSNNHHDYYDRAEAYSSVNSKVPKILKYTNATKHKLILTMGLAMCFRMTNLSVTINEGLVTKTIFNLA